MYDISSIYQARSVSDAIDALRADPDAVIICGGSDVLIKIREGKLAGCSLVSIHGLPELSHITMEADGTIVIGPACTFAEVTQHPVIQEHIPILGEAVDQAGGPQLRNIGTIGGNICNGVTSADSATSLLVLNALLQITGPDGTRTVRQEEFYRGPGKVALEHGEVLTAIRIAPEDYMGFSGHYIKYAQRNAMDIATLGCAVNVKLATDGEHIDEFRLAYGVAAPTPIRCRGIEAAVQGASITPELFEQIGRGALAEVSPRDSWRASKAFREQLVYELSGRALKAALAKTKGAVQA